MLKAFSVFMSNLNYHLLLASLALLAVSAAACTREKPASPLPTPVLVALDSTPPAPPTFPPFATAAATSIIPLTTPGATETPSGPPAPPTSQPPSTVIMIPTNTPAAAGATPTPQISTQANPSAYTVQFGDTLFKIASQFGVSVDALRAANPGINPNFIYPGQVLKIPSASAPTTGQTPSAAQPTGTPAPSTGLPATYTVQRGDWLYAIARRFGISVSALQAANPGININVLVPGTVLRIPGGGAIPVPVTTPASATNPTSYTVRAGDTLFSIAVRFGTTTYALQIANNLTNPNFVYPGQVLVIPK